MWGDSDRRETPNYGSTEPRYSSLPTAHSPSRGPSSTQQFHQLYDSISSSIFSINNATVSLERGAKQLGTQADNRAFRDRIHATQQSTNDTIKATASQLGTLSSLASSGDKQLKLQSERLRNEFQDVVRRYSTIQKQVATRQKYTMALPSPRAGGEPTYGWGGEEKQPLIEADETQVQAQKQIIADLDHEHAILMEREERIREIEADVLDCNQIFKDLATLVHDQGGVIDTIASNIENTEYNTAEAVDQLRSASQYQAKARKKMCCLAIVVTIGAIVMALVLYFTLK
ncbi:syntaxin-12-like isoform X2 [Ornithodoros turicata]